MFQPYDPPETEAMTHYPNRAIDDLHIYLISLLFPQDSVALIIGFALLILLQKRSSSLVNPLEVVNLSMTQLPLTIYGLRVDFASVTISITVSDFDRR